MSPSRSTNTFKRTELKTPDLSSQEELDHVTVEVIDLRLWNCIQADSTNYIRACNVILQALNTILHFQSDNVFIGLLTGALKIHSRPYVV